MAFLRNKGRSKAFELKIYNTGSVIKEKIKYVTSKKENVNVSFLTKELQVVSVLPFISERQQNIKENV